MSASFALQVPPFGQLAPLTFGKMLPEPKAPHGFVVGGGGTAPTVIVTVYVLLEVPLFTVTLTVPLEFTFVVNEFVEV